MISATTAPFAIPNFLQGIRSELHESISSLTLKIQQAVSQPPLNVFLTGQWLSELHSKLSRKEWALWLGNALGWSTAIARQLINVAISFKNFDPSKLSGIEPQSLFRVSAKKYREPLEQLCFDETITQETIDRLLKETRQKKEPKPQTRWRQTKAGGGRYLKFQANLHDEESGMLIESILEEQGITQQEFLRRAAQLMAGQKQDSGVEPAIELVSTDNPSADTETQEFETTQLVAEQDQSSATEEIEPELINDASTDTDETRKLEPEALDVVAEPVQMCEQDDKALQQPLTEEEVLAEALQGTTTWEEVENLVQQYPDVKFAAWKLLPREERRRIKRLQPFDAVAALEKAKSKRLIFDYCQDDGVWLINTDGFGIEPVSISGLPLFLQNLKKSILTSTSS